MCGCTHWESVEQVCEHLSGQRALSLAHEGAQSLSEDGRDPIHIHAADVLQLHTQLQIKQHNVRDNIIWLTNAKENVYHSNSEPEMTSPMVQKLKIFSFLPQKIQ